MKKERILYSEEDIRMRVKEMAKEIDAYYEGREVLVIGLLRGCFIFCSDLVRAMDSKMEIDFMTTSSYENKFSSSGEVKVLNDLRTDVKGRDVLIVDDIIDTGHTLETVHKAIHAMEPASVKCAVMLDKPSRREVDFSADFVGFTIDDVFIVGYGLNYGPYFRNKPYIYTYEED
ncbi:MAG: hypoxanthine phosphoribosyltransferase [Peptoniphilus sp.]|nr:hypoxanthine phosphoribosyltransferase [Peptoniphilus sp.]MDD7362533.1 hypoxanthine phosphoribosyltransferase [Bacillota bacterium]MDY6045068.1 hypoxanthine phosphoribosyltransferase [Peptoniphilus sp.]